MGWNLFLVGRLYQALCAVIVLGCAAYVNHDLKQTKYGVPGSINFLIFVPTFTFLTLIYNTLPWIVPSFYHPAAVLVCIGIEFLNLVFWLSGFAAVIAFLRSLIVCRGPLCTATRTCAAFSFLATIGYLTTTAGLSWWLYMLRKDMGVVKSVHRSDLEVVIETRERACGFSSYSPSRMERHSRSLSLSPSRYRPESPRLPPPRSPRDNFPAPDFEKVDTVTTEPSRGSVSTYGTRRSVKYACRCRNKNKCPHRRRTGSGRHWAHGLLTDRDRE